MANPPRDEIWSSIEDGDLHSLLDKAAGLHGHHCPGLALGVKASYTALQKLDVKPEGMEEILAIVETNNCSTDGVQYMTGCTFGNNSLIFRDLGKTAVSLIERDGKGIRIVTRQDAGEHWKNEFQEYQKLFEKVVSKRDATEEEKERFSESGKKVSHYIMEIESEELFKIEETSFDLPDHAPIHESLTCEDCGESVMSTRTVEREREILCLECSGSDFFELTGFGIHKKGEEHER